MKQFYETYCNTLIVVPLVRQLQTTENQINTIVSPLVTQLTDIRNTILAQISWTHHLIIFARTKSEKEREFYIRLCIRERYSKRELDRQISSGLSSPNISASWISTSKPSTAMWKRNMKTQASASSYARAMTPKSSNTPLTVRYPRHWSHLIRPNCQTNGSCSKSGNNSSNRKKKHQNKKTSPSGRSVRVIGLEPTRLAAPDPKSGASANFATLALSKSCAIRSSTYLPDSQEYRLWANLPGRRR